MKKREFLKQLRAKSAKDLFSELKKSYQEKERTVFNFKVGKEKNIQKLSEQKKEIAQILTIIGEKAEGGENA